MKFEELQLINFKQGILEINMLNIASTAIQLASYTCSSMDRTLKYAFEAQDADETALSGCRFSKTISS